MSLLIGARAKLGFSCLTPGCNKGRFRSQSELIANIKCRAIAKPIAPRRTHPWQDQSLLNTKIVRQSKYTSKLRLNVNRGH
jgi:hypothetical protein